MKILRIKDDYVTLYELRNWLNDNNVLTGFKFGISWKVGKRWKLKAYRLLNVSYWDCDCCGGITEIEIGRGNHSINLDNHFGPSTFGINS